MGFMQSLALWKKLIMWLTCIPLVPLFCIVYIIFPNSQVVFCLCVFYVCWFVCPSFGPLSRPFERPWTLRPRGRKHGRASVQNPWSLGRIRCLFSNRRVVRSSSPSGNASGFHRVNSMLILLPCFGFSLFCCFVLFFFRSGKPYGVLPRSSSHIPSPISASSSYLPPPPFAWTVRPTPWPTTSPRISLPSPTRVEGPTWPLSGSTTFRGPRGVGRRIMRREWTGCSWPPSGPPMCSWRTSKSASCSGYLVGNVLWQCYSTFLHGMFVFVRLILFFSFIFPSPFPEKTERGVSVFCSWVRKFFRFFQRIAFCRLGISETRRPVSILFETFLLSVVNDAWLILTM